MNPLPIVAARTNPHYERLGGQPAVIRLVDAFYQAMSTRPDAAVIRAMHAADLTATRQVLYDYLGEWLGGPRNYSARRGLPKLRRIHLPFAVDQAARDAWLACMNDALLASCDDALLRDDLLAAFGRIADHIVNTDSPSNPRSPA